MGAWVAAAGLAVTVGSKIAAAQAAKKRAKAAAKLGGGGGSAAPNFGEGPFFGGFQRATLSGLPSAAIRQRALEFGQADWGGEALQSLRAARPGLMPAPGEDVFRGDLYNAGQDINTLEGARRAFQASMGRYGEFGERAQGRGEMALGTERLARPMVEQGLASPFALGPQSEALFGQRWGLQRNLLLAEQAKQAGALRERLAGRFGPGYQSGTPFLAEEEGYVTRPYVEGLTRLGIGDIESRMGAARWQRGYERNILEDSVRAQSLAARDELTSSRQSDLMASELQRSGFDMAKLRSEDARARMMFLQKAQHEMPNLMKTPLDTLKDIRTIQGGGGGGGGTFQTRPSGPGMIGGMMGEIGGAGMQFGARAMGEARADERQKRALEARYGRQAVTTQLQGMPSGFGEGMGGGFMDYSTPPISGMRLGDSGVR